MTRKSGGPRTFTESIQRRLGNPIRDVQHGAVSSLKSENVLPFFTKLDGDSVEYREEGSGLWNAERWSNALPNEEHQ